jgi:hypothetical protein
MSRLQAVTHKASGKSGTRFFDSLCATLAGSLRDDDVRPLLRWPGMTAKGGSLDPASLRMACRGEVTRNANSK